ncbi:hypothetical protein QA640_17750 [Bradyrhizobium sp. CB82]|uniref:hypothetical protein n=1 Tax=Bradyrhizobium sp. CB82 TaxID=3039159 RepID=UPI0024B180E4|nr:hypothetical protein [Bradyrhizobium sp. CB82]WFU44127.1 hypothetical protein QA640_17750 [Bradyrhizobium sp. CB82]
MNEQIPAVGDGQFALQDAPRDEHELVDWYVNEGRPCLAVHIPDRQLPDNEIDRIRSLAPDRTMACFLGHSGIGKSALLNTLAARRSHPYHPIVIVMAVDELSVGDGAPKD